MNAIEATQQQVTATIVDDDEAPIADVAAVPTLSFRMLLALAVMLALLVMIRLR